jgi:hypothetical protein
MYKIKIKEWRDHNIEINELLILRLKEIALKRRENGYTAEKTIEKKMLHLQRLTALSPSVIDICIIRGGCGVNSLRMGLNTVRRT